MDDENNDGATPSKNNKNVHSAAWAKEFVDKRAHLGAVDDQKTHTIHYKFCRHMYLEQAEPSTSGNFAFAKGIPDGWKWEDEIYAHFKKQVRQPHPTKPGEFIVPRALMSHMMALQAYTKDEPGLRRDHLFPSLTT